MEAASQRRARADTALTPGTIVKMNARTIGLLALLLIVFVWSGFDFLRSRVVDTLYPAAGLTSTTLLSAYNARLQNTRGDSEIYTFTGSEPGGTVLVLGGVHPNEPAGYLAAVLLVERLSVSRGRFIVIPRANHSAFTHTEPGEATPRLFDVQTTGGARAFRVGSRATNPLDQWPDPEVYRHFPSGQELSGSETRNLNRAFPGRARGSFTEQIAFAITELVRREHVDLVIDLHEASPEYPVINAIVAHDRALELATLANLNLQVAGLNYAVEPSPQNFHGLSHRELGDTTSAFATLMETANIMQGRLRGAGAAAKVLSGIDPCYLTASRAQLVRVPYDSAGISLDVRVGRHLAGIAALVEALAATDAAKTVIYAGIPGYDELQTKHLGDFLSPPQEAHRLK